MPLVPSPTRYRSYLTLLSLFLILSLPVYANEPIEKKQTISVGLFPDDYPPMFWHTGRKGIIQKTLDEISTRSHFVFEEKLYPFNRIIQKVANGQLDLEAWTSQVWREGVSSKVYFTEPFAEHCEIIVLRKDSSLSIFSPEDLLEKRLGVVQDFTFPTFQPYFKNKKIIRNDSRDEERVLNLLSRNRNDAALVDEQIARYLMRTTFPGKFTTGNRFDCVPVSFMFSKKLEAEGRQINMILQALKKEGIIEKILDEYR